MATFNLDALGYSTLASGESVRGVFTRVEVYSIQGFILDVPYLLHIEDSIGGIAFRLGIGASLNEVFKLLVDGDFVEDEEQWQKDNQCKPPFLLVSFGPTKEYIGSGFHYRDHGDIIETYDSFREAKQELKKYVDAVVPSLLSSFSLTFSSEERPVRFIPRQSAVAGKTIDGKTIIDLRFEVSANLYVSTQIDEATVANKVSAALNLAKESCPKISRFYFNGLNEKDPLKRFLFLFLYVERLINATFGSIDHKRGSLHTIVKPHPSRDVWSEASGRAS